MLQIGITGHRPNNLPTDWRVSLTESLRSLFRRLQRLAGPKESTCLLSGFAAGTDLAAVWAQERLEGRTKAILPFSMNEYEKDFEETCELPEFRAALETALTVDELPGLRAKADEAYEAVGRAILEACDVLVAVWDGQPGRGKGGTRHVMDMAIARGIPVIHLDPRKTAADAMLTCASEGSVRKQARLFDLSSSDFRKMMTQPAARGGL